MNPHTSRRCHDPLFTTPALRAIFSDHGRLQGMLDFEAALARAGAACGVIPASAVPAIEAACDASRYDVEMLAAEAALAGNLAIPLVKQLTACVGAADVQAARWVHWGATSQDAMDSGLVLQLRAALDGFDTGLAAFADVLATLAATQRATLLAGRTWLQHAPPVTLGLKAAGWLDAVLRHRERLRELRPRVLVPQFGGAVGTLAALGEAGPAIAVQLAAELGLALPALPWHGARDRLAEVATALGLLSGTLGKIARDLSLLMQTDTAEAFEPAGAGRGGSSTMPHKRNPVGCAVALAAAVRVPNLVATMLAAMVQEHERGLGGWHAEWETLPEIAILAGGALAQLHAVLAGLEIDAARMRANLDATYGLTLAEAVMMALGERIGRLDAHHLIGSACRSALAGQRPLRAVLGEMPAVTEHLAPAELDRLLDPAAYLGATGVFVERVLSAHARAAAAMRP